MTIIPMGNTVLLEWVKYNMGGIELPDTIQMNDMVWVVLDVGQGQLLPSGVRAPITLKAGDHVILSQTVGTKSLLPQTLTDNRKMAVVDLESIRAVIRDFEPNYKPKITQGQLVH